MSVTEDEITSVRPLTSAGWWYDIGGTSWDFGVTKDGPDNDPALKISTTSSSDKIYLFNVYAPADRPTDILALIDDASYTYAGANVNFQLEVIFEPTDVAAYGPAGSVAACTPATTWYGWGLSSDPDWCYTVLKWEPFASTTTWSTQDISQNVAANSPTSTAGWIAQRRVGNIAPPGVFIGQQLTTILAQMADYEVTALVFGNGSGNSTPKEAWVKEYTVGGTTYTFSPTANAPAPAPAPDTGGLEQLIDDESIDVDANTALFVPTGSTNTDLSKVDPTKPLNGEFQHWPNPEDAFVDAYTYSTALFVGSYPVINGAVHLSNVDLSTLSGGTHYLLLRGQTSGAYGVVQFNVVGLASTGPDTVVSMTMGGAALLLLAAGVMLRVRSSRRTA